MSWIDEAAEQITQTREMEAWKAQRGLDVARHTASLWSQLSYSIKAGVHAINNNPTLCEATGGLRLSELSMDELEIRSEGPWSARLKVVRFSQSFEVERRTQRGFDLEPEEEFDGLFVRLDDNNRPYIETKGGRVLASIDEACQYLLRPLISGRRMQP